MLAGAFALIFAAPDLGSQWLEAGWVLVFFVLAASAYAFFQVPYVAMPAEITTSYDERTRLMTWRVAILAFTIMLAGATAPVIRDAVGGRDGYRVMGVVMSLVILVGVVSAWWGTRHAPIGAVSAGAGSLREQLRVVGRARDFRVLLTTFVLQALATGCMLAGVAYVAEDLLGRSGAATVLFVCFVGPALLLTPLWARWGERVGKKQGYVAASLVLAAGAALAVLARGGNDVWTFVATGLVGVGYAGCQVFPMAMLPDVAAVDAARTGENRAGVYTGVWTAGETLGLALGPAVFALMLALGGYLSSEGRDISQPDSALTAIALGFSIVPAALTILSLWWLRQYTLDPAEVAASRPTRKERSVPDPLERLAALQAGDLPVHGGRTLAYVYDSGDPEIDRVAREAVAAYAASNALDPTAFPSLLQMENELVGFACGLLDAPDGAVGTVTSGGTESILLAVQGARDSRPDVRHPRMVLPATAHAAFHKAAHYFGVEAVLVPVGPDFRADAAAMAAAIDDDTVLVVASAPSYAHGVVDPVTEIAAAAAARGVRCHVDACIGGWVLPYAARLGRPVPPWTFAVDGVTSISVDTHKYAYAPKGTSLLLHRDAGLRRPQFFASAAWPGYTMLNATTQSTRSGGPIAGTWAVVEHIGDDGYLDLTDRALAAVDAIVACIEWEPGLRVVVPPDSTLVTLATDETLDPFTLTDELVARGWYVQPQLSFGDQGPSVHLSVSAGTLPHVQEFAAALSESVAAARAAGPVAVDEGVVAFIEALDPAALGDDDFDGLLAASGLVGASADGELELPTRMAEVNAMLDVASPAMREALLVAFLDRLQRPAAMSAARGASSRRGGWPPTGPRPSRRWTTGSRPWVASCATRTRPAAATSPPPTGSSGRSSARSPTYACWWSGRTPTRTRATRSG